MAITEHEFYKAFNALTTAEKLKAGKLAAEIGQLKNKNDWRKAYTQIDAKLSVCVRYLAPKVWLQIQSQSGTNEHEQLSS
jgi:hypothetical protein